MFADGLRRASDQPISGTNIAIGSAQPNRGGKSNALADNDRHNDTGRHARTDAAVHGCNTATDASPNPPTDAGSDAASDAASYIDDGIG